MERNIIGDYLMEGVGDQVVEFVEWFKKTSSGVVSIMDVLAWVIFVNSSFKLHRLENRIYGEKLTYKK